MILTPREVRRLKMARQALGQLRHLYRQMIEGNVIHAADAARGLLGPAIEALEPLLDPSADD